MRLVTVQFNYAKNMYRPDYAKLLEVFEKSIRRHMPRVEIRSVKVDPPNHLGAVKIPFLSNTYKLQIWAREIEQAVADGVEVCLADCDMLCTGDCRSVFDRDFDIAYTARDDHTNIPVNGGILFVKPTDASVRFFRKWAEIDDMMYKDWAFHQNWRVKYAGMNQASFGYLLEKSAEVPGVKLIDLPTTTYNAVNTDWARLHSGTVFIHVKSQLRKMVLKNEPPVGDLRPAMEAWYAERDRVEVRV